MSPEALDKELTVEADRDQEAAIVKTSVRFIYRMFESNMESLGGIESAAGICGCERGDLRRALDRSGRYLAIDHFAALIARMRKHNPAVATQIAAAIVRPADLLVFPRVQLSPEERARRLEKLVRSMPLGDQLVASALESP